VRNEEERYMTTVGTKERRTPEIAQPTPIPPFARKVLSKDGTAIAFDRIGAGPAVILIDGALCYRGMGQSGKLANLMAKRFTVFTYDRRGRGASSDTAPYAVEREVEDIEALLSEAGGTASVWGVSSGAVLALEAANLLKGIKKLALLVPLKDIADWVEPFRRFWEGKFASLDDYLASAPKAKLRVSACS